MRARRAVRQAARWGLGRGWARFRPGTVTDLRVRAGQEAPRDGTPPRPDQVFVARTQSTGPWAAIDPLVADRWYSRSSALVTVAMWTFIAHRVRGGIASEDHRRGRAVASERRTDSIPGSRRSRPGR